MLITRHGSSAYHGSYHIDLDSPKVSWDAKTDCIVMSDHSVQDFDTYAHHNYKISISFEELIGIINTLGLKAIKESPDEIDEGLAPAFRALVRLTNHLGGIAMRKDEKEE